MISVIFPPGGYGTFLVSCLYYFTELNNGSTREPIIDNNGSSHMLRHDTSFVIGDKMQAQLQFTHMPFGSVGEFDVSKFYPEQSVVLLGSNNHCLDYFVNNFVKMQYSLHDLINVLFGKDTAEHYDSLTTWEAREHISFWLLDVLQDTYNIDQYRMHNSLQVNVQSLLDEEFKVEFPKICQKLGLNILDQQAFTKHHDNFKRLQKINNLQNRCDDYVDAILSGRHMESPCLTIFDEAYIQLKLRERGFELECFGLNDFPETSEGIAELLHSAN